MNAFDLRYLRALHQQELFLDTGYVYLDYHGNFPISIKNLKSKSLSRYLLF